MTSRQGLGTGVLLQLLFYFSILIVPISLPLAVLLSSLMTYGNLGEHHELTAIKASGIALTRILRPVLLLTVALAVGAFWFNETIVPKANLKPTACFGMCGSRSRRWISARGCSTTAFRAIPSRWIRKPGRTATSCTGS